MTDTAETTGAELLEEVFDAQRDAEAHLDEACRASGSDAYEVPEGVARDGEASAYAAAAASLRRAAGILDQLAERTSPGSADPGDMGFGHRCCGCGERLGVDGDGSWVHDRNGSTECAAQEGA